MGTTDVKAISRRRGYSAEFKTFTSGLEGELTVNQTNWSVVVSDGDTNNYEMSRADMRNVEQANILKRSIASNDLSNTVLTYHSEVITDETTGETTTTEYETRKNSSAIKAQLTAAYIADKDLSNVPLAIFLNKGIAKSTLKNVPITASSWYFYETDLDSDKVGTEHLGGNFTDYTGGGLVFRNLTNVDITAFNNTVLQHPTSNYDDNGKQIMGIVDVDGVSKGLYDNGGLAWRNFANVTELSRDVLKVTYLTRNTLSNVKFSFFSWDDETKEHIASDYRDDGTVYVGGVDPTGGGLLYRNFSNSYFIGKDQLTTTGISAVDLSNLDITQNLNGKDETQLRSEVAEKLDLARIDMSNTSRKSFTTLYDINLTDDNAPKGQLQLMSWDGANAYQDKVFKGNKNLLVNSDFSFKHSVFTETGDLTNNEYANNGDCFYSNWVAFDDASRISVNSKTLEVSFQGVWGQCIPWMNEFNSITQLYFSSEIYGGSLFTVSLHQYQNGVLTLISNEVALDNVTNVLGNTSRYYNVLTIDSTKVLENTNLILIIKSAYNTETSEYQTSTLKKIQLERTNVTNYEAQSSQLKSSLNNYGNRKVSLVNMLDELPSDTIKCVLLFNTFTSDSGITCYALLEDLISKGLVDEEGVLIDSTVETLQLPYNCRTFIVVDNIIQFYKYAADGQFNVVISTVEGTTNKKVTISEYSEFYEGSLVFNKENNKIYTYTGKSFNFAFDTVPYEDTLYIDLKVDSGKIYKWDLVHNQMVAVTADGDSSSTGSTFPLFTQLLSDRKLESANWVRSENFSPLYASIYSSAYEYLVNQYSPVGKMVAGGVPSLELLYAWKRNDIISSDLYYTKTLDNLTTNTVYLYDSDGVFTSKVEPEVFAATYVRQSDKDKTIKPLDTVSYWIIDWSDNYIENTFIPLKEKVETTVSGIQDTSLKDALEKLKVYIQLKGYTILNEETEELTIYNIRIGRSITPVTDAYGVTYYPTFDDLKIVLASVENETLLTQLYDNYDYAWYYVLKINDDVTKAYFRLPRAKGFGQEELTNGAVLTSSGVPLENQKRYFFVGNPVYKSEEIVVGRIFEDFSELRDLKTNLLSQTSNIYDYGTDLTKIYVKVNKTTQLYEIRNCEDTLNVYFDLSEILGDKDPYYDEETHSYTFFKEEFSTNSNYTFRFVLDTRDDIDVDNPEGEKTQMEVSFINNLDSTEVISLPNIYTNNVYVFDVKTYVKRKWLHKTYRMDGEEKVIVSEPSNLSRSMFGYNFVLKETSTWGTINGTLSNQTDLQTALNNKIDTSKIQVVTTLPETQVQDVFYFVIEE